MIKTIDLFAGAGGLSFGFLMTGEYKLVAAAEINNNAQKTYKAIKGRRSVKMTGENLKKDCICI